MLRTVSIAVSAAMLATSGAALAKAVRGSSGNDTLVGTPRADVMSAYAGDDDLYGGAGNDRLYGGAGKDHIWAGAGSDVIVGGPHGDLALTTPFHRHERIFGGDGNDTIIMRVAGALVFAGSGNDRIDVRDPQNSCKVKPGVRSQQTVRSTQAPATPGRKLDPPHCVNLVNTGRGDNFVRADDGNHDSISCVGGRDRVIIDQYDVAPEECEVVRMVER